jgi:hypothetical protein
MRRFGGCDPALTSPHSIQDLLAEMNRAGIQRAIEVLPSEAKRFTHPQSETRHRDGNHVHVRPTIDARLRGIDLATEPQPLWCAG